jgi:acetyltransferase-like isoleucine patch superfamily enzyme
VRIRIRSASPERTWSQRYRSQVLVGPGRLAAGEWTYWFPTCRFVTWAPEDTITIGSFTSIAAGTTILCGGEHTMDRVTQYPLASMLEPGHQPSANPAGYSVRIGSDVWLATDAMVLAPLVIGDGAVIAARSVVTHDVPAYGVVAGSPARLVRYRFSEAEIELLLKLRWWDWPIDRIREAAELLGGTDVCVLEEFAHARGLLAESTSQAAPSG